jgi:isopentenyl-diphosphate delta-isomerase
MKKTNQVVLVDKKDNQVGLMDRNQAHAGEGILHRAVSVQLIRKRGSLIEALIQKRSGKKLLWPGFWTNTICTHPYDKESPPDCVKRRLKEELRINIDKSYLKEIYTFIYQFGFDRNYSEHEYDHVFIGLWNRLVVPDRNEAEEIKWISMSNLNDEITKFPNSYTPWFKKIINHPVFIDEITKL